MVMGGLERASTGRVRVLGTDLGAAGEDTLARLRRARIGVVFQSFHLIPTMTALENVAVPLEIAGRGDAFDRAARMLDEVGLSARGGHYPAQLSGGEQQRAAIARALATGPELLLADEPTGNLDGRTGGQITDLLFRLADEGGVTLVLVTHEPDLASRCGRQVALASGRIVDGRAPKAETVGGNTGNHAAGQTGARPPGAPAAGDRPGRADVVAGQVAAGQDR
jgi:putative ABC transport system ATP-binding protein